jgi:hypothetical protein
MSKTNLFTVIAADAEAAVHALTAGLKWFGDEARLAIAWVDRNIPGAQATLAALFKAADTAAASLESHAAAGFSDVVSTAIEGAGAYLASLIAGSGLDLTARRTLTAADVAAVTAAQSIAQGAISVAAARLLAETAQAAAAAASANAAPPAAR